MYIPDRVDDGLAYPGFVSLFLLDVSCFLEGTERRASDDSVVRLTQGLTQLSRSWVSFLTVVPVLSPIFFSECT